MGTLKREIGSANIYFAAGRIISLFIGFFSSVILARLLGSYSFGLYSFCLTIVTFFVIFTDFGLMSTLVRFLANYMSKERYGKAGALARMVFKYKAFLGIVVGFLISALSHPIAGFVFNKPEAWFMVFLAGFVIIARSFYGFFYSLFSGLKDFKYVSLVQSLQMLFKFIFAVVLVLLGFEAFGAIVGVTLSFLAVIVLSVLLIIRKYGFILKKPKASIEKRALLSFSAWVFVGSIAGTIFSLTDQMMISAMLPIENVGFYGIAITWKAAIVSLVPIASSVLYPYFSGAKNKEQLNMMFFNSLRYGAIFVFPLAFVLSAYAEPFILFLYKEPFLQAASVLRILTFISIFSVLWGILMQYFNSIKRPDIATKVFSGVIVLNIILNYFLIQLYGIVGAAISTLFCGFIILIILFSITIFVKKLVFKPAIILNPLIASGAVYLVSLYFLPYVTNYFNLAFYGALSLVVYFVIMLMIRGITKEDLIQFRGIIFRRV